MTLFILYFVGIVLLAWEIYTIVNRVAGDTISATLRRIGFEQTAVPLFMGALMRHLWGDNERAKAAFMAGWEAGEYWPCIDHEAVSPFDAPPTVKVPAAQ